MLMREGRGFVLLGMVVVIWVLSGFLIQRILQPSEFNHPVTMTVLSVGLCGLLLLIPREFREPKHESAVKPLLKYENRDKSTQIVILGIIWLAGQLLYNMSLRHMSVSANTAVSSSSSVFTFLFSVLLLRGYSITIPAVCALACSSAGVLVIANLTTEGPETGSHSSVLGVVMALIACACYGLFTTLLKLYYPSDKTMSVVSLFGYLGMVAWAIGIPLIAFAHLTDIDPFSLPTSTRVISGIIANSLVGSVLSDILLAQSVLLLNPITVSIGLTFTMPFSSIIDSAVFGYHPFQIASLAAMTLQLTAICLISYDNRINNRI
jgi:solute carrier family 35 protein F5